MQRTKRLFSTALAALCSLFVLVGCQDLANPIGPEDENAPVNGVVIDADLNAVINAIVEARLENGTVVCTDTTDEDGGFSLRDLPKDISKVKIRIRAEGFNDELVELRGYLRSAMNSLSVSMRGADTACAGLSLLLTDSSGIVLKDVKITIKRAHDHRSIRSCKPGKGHGHGNGHRRFKHMSRGGYIVKVTLEGYLDLEEIVDLRDCDSLIKSFKMRRDERCNGSDSTDAKCTGRIELRLLDSTGLAFTQRAEVLLLKGGLTTAMSTAVNGSAIFNGLCPGDYTLRFAGELKGTEEVHVKVNGDTTLVERWDPLESTCRHASLSIL